MASGSLFCIRAFVLLALATTAFSQLSPNFYDNSCPHALSTIQSAVRMAIYKERRMGGSLLRLHFHDCFVNVRTTMFPLFSSNLELTVVVCSSISIIFQKPYPFMIYINAAGL
jgi:hypothetical protein